MFEVKSHFIGNFKVGDNINHNIKILTLLYEYYDHESDENKNLLRKPIIVIIVSIIEAIFSDLFFRATKFTNEGIKNLDLKTLEDIRSKKKLDELGVYISLLKKYEVFGAKHLKIYEKLDDLRKIRNRVHIQNAKDQFERDEDEVFTEERKILAEKCLEKVAKTLSSKHGRSKGRHHTVDFEFPWKEQLK